VAVTNTTFIFTVLGQATEAFAVSGFGTFLPRVAESIFGITPARSSLTIGLVVIFGAGGGTFLGSYIAKKLRLRLRRIALMTAVVAIVGVFFMFGFFIGCDTVKLAGVNTPYTSGLPINGINLTSSCNAGCGCNPDVYQPVCGADGITYFSGCHAGCQQSDSPDPFSAQTYLSCTCIPAANNVTQLLRFVSALYVKPGFTTDVCR